MEAVRGEGSGGAEALHRSSKRKGSEWEILVNLEKGVHYTIKPKRCKSRRKYINAAAE